VQARIRYEETWIALVFYVPQHSCRESDTVLGNLSLSGRSKFTLHVVMSQQIGNSIPRPFPHNPRNVTCPLFPRHVVFRRVRKIAKRDYLFRQVYQSVRPYGTARLLLVDFREIW